MKSWDIQLAKADLICLFMFFSSDMISYIFYSNRDFCKIGITNLQLIKKIVNDSFIFLMQFWVHWFDVCRIYMLFFSRYVLVLIYSVLEYWIVFCINWIYIYMFLVFFENFCTILMLRVYCYCSTSKRVPKKKKYSLSYY